MKHLPSLVACMALAVLGCSSSSDEGDGFDRVIGQTCGDLKKHSSAVHTSGSAWDVTVYYDHETTQIVADKNGVLREQTVQSCPSIIGLGATDSSIIDERTAIDYVANLFSVFPVY